jgi:hypothetical protein
MIPAGGLFGATLVEARKSGAAALPDLMSRIETAARTALGVSGVGHYAYILGLWADHVIISQSADGGSRKLWSFAWGEDAAGAVTLTAKTEVVETHVPVAAKMAEAAGGVLAEAADGGGAPRYKVRVIRAGLSGNNNFYSDAVLREALPLFKGVRVFAVSDAEHIEGAGKDVRNLIGRIDGAVFVEGAAADSGEIQAVLTLIDAADPLAVKIREAVAGGMADLFGLSIQANGVVRDKAAGRVKIHEAVKLTKVKSVDLIVEPGAGGAILSLIEALIEAPQNSQTQKEADAMLREALIEKIKSARPDLLAGKDVTKIDDAGLTALLTEALASPPTPAPNAATAEEVARLVESRLVQGQLAKAKMREAVARSKLPPAARAKVQNEFEVMAEFTEAQVEARLTEEAAYLVSLGAAGGRVTGLGDRPLFESMEDRRTKVGDMLDAFFDPEHKDHRHARSFRECYVEITGDMRFTGLTKNCDQVRLSEALGTGDFPTLLGDALHRRMLSSYNGLNLDFWRLLTGAPIPANDFKERKVGRLGGYGDLIKVAERQPYLEVVSPTEDDPAAYAVQKRGGVESISLEMIRGDDVGIIRQIPVQLGRAAKRTLCKFVLDFIRLNPAIYDGKALFHVDHANLGTAALSAEAVAAARLAMVKQTEFGLSGETLGLPPKYLWVPADLEQTAADIFKRDTNIDETFIQSLKPTVVPVWYWTDPNDWAMSVDVLDRPIIEIAFLDGNEEPELFVQDSPTSGSMFSNETVTYKVRQIYGGAVVDYRGLRKHVAV